MAQKTREKNTENKFTVRVLGEDHTVVGDLSRDYLESLAERINTIGEDIARAYPNIPRRQLIRLTLLNLADHCQKAERKNQELQKELERERKSCKKLREEIERLRQDNNELMELLQEVD